MIDLNILTLCLLGISFFLNVYFFSKVLILNEKFVISEKIIMESREYIHRLCMEKHS